MNHNANTDAATPATTAWDSFWFQPCTGHTMAAVRIGTGMLLLSYFVSFGWSLSEWLASGHTLLPTTTLAELTGTPWWTWSVFDVTHSVPLAWCVLGIGLLLAVALTLGIGGRVCAVMAFVVYLMFVHRLRPVTGLAEPILTMLLLYTIVSPGAEAIGFAAWRKQQVAQSTLRSSWTNTLAMRLVQIHLTALVLMTVLTRLAGTAWWSGEAVWWLIARTETRLVDLTGMNQPPAFFAVNLWTHAIIAIELLSVVMLWQPRWRRAAAIALVAASASLVLVTGELTWCLAIAIACVSFVSPAWLARQCTRPPDRA